MINGDSKFQSMYLEDIDDNPMFNPGIAYPGLEPPAEDYGDMVTEEQPDEDDLDDEVIDKYINVELIFGISTNNEIKGSMIKCSWGLDSEPFSHAHSNLSLTPKNTKLNS